MLNNISVVTNKDIKTKLKELSINEQLAIVQKYCPDFRKLGEAIRAPYRNDLNPSLSVYIGRDGDKVLMKDFARNIVMDVLGLIMECEKVSFIEGANILFNQKFVKKQTIELKPKVQKETDISVIDGKDYSYWEKFEKININMLNFYNIYPVRKAWINGHVYYVESKDDPCYSIKLKVGNKVKMKLYRPLAKSKSLKFRTNIPNEYYFGSEQAPFLKSLKKLIICSSMKEILIYNILGYKAISPQSENSDLNMNAIRQIYKYPTIIYDSDNPGITAANKMSNKYNVNKIVLDLGKHKDIADYYMEYGYSKTKDMFFDYECYL